MTGVAMPRRARPGPAVALTPLVDVLLILLIFFMVTSTYLDLDMIPLVEPGEMPVEAPGEPGPAGDAPGVVLVRVDAGGRAFVAGAALDPAALGREIARRLAARPGAAVLILPSPRASVQALVDVFGAASVAGAARVEVVRFDNGASP